MARPKRGKKKYSLSYLVYRQPKTIRRHRDYPELLARLNNSERLRKLRIDRRCYSLLDRAVIKAEHLRNFYSTYRLPEDSFFALFFRIKADYLVRRNSLKLQRQQYIREKMASLPAGIRDTLLRLEQYEQKLHRSRRHPVWNKYFIPKTKKKADWFGGLGHAKWIEYFSVYLEDCNNCYPGRKLINPDRIIAAFVLDLDGDDVSEQDVIRQYRIHSKQAHPDQGGSAELFRTISWAKDILLRK